VKNISNIIKNYENIPLKETICLLCKEDAGALAAKSIDDAYNFCKYIALGHYENFPVGSVLIPKQIRKHFFSVYSFSRFADDIADIPDILSNAERIEYLSELENILNYFRCSNTNNPIFLALFQTIREFDIPVSTLKKLITAFKIDVNFKQAETIIDLEKYCYYSANPVGELILRLFGNYNEITATLSDKICTGLQLLNFWQDLSVDLKNGRHYIPISFYNDFNLSKDTLFSDENSLKLENCINELLKITEKYFFDGKLLIKHIDNFRLKLELKVIILAGLYFLRKIKKLKINLLYERPKLTKSDSLKIFIKALVDF